jgi:hypothetical protein
VCHVQRESVKAAGLFSSRFLPPGCRSDIGAGRKKPISKVKSMSVARMRPRSRSAKIPQVHRKYLPQRLSISLRERIEMAIQAHLDRAESYIRLLDRFDGDADFEPSIGALQTPINAVDAEGEHDGSEYSWNETHGGDPSGNCLSEDDEPSLAHTNDINQEIAHKHVDGENLRAAPGASDWIYADKDQEEEHDGREPSLGARNPHFPTMRDRGLSQEFWAEGDNGVGADECEDRSDDDVCDTDIATAGCMAT